MNQEEVIKQVARLEDLIARARVEMDRVAKEAADKARAELGDKDESEVSNNA